MAIVCPECSTELPFEAYNEDRGVAKCPKCFAVFNFRSRAQEVVHGGAPGARHAPVPTRAPAGIRVRQDGERLEVRRSWIGLDALLSGGAALFMWFVLATEAYEASRALSAVWTAAAAAVSYYALAKLLNGTTLEVTRRWTRLRHGPLPWPGGKTVPSASITQLYCKCIPAYRRWFDFAPPELDSLRYELRAIVRTEGYWTLMQDFTSADGALYVERLVEDWLRIEDRAVVATDTVS